MTHDPSNDPYEVIKDSILDTKMTYYLVLLNADQARDLKQHNKPPKPGEQGTNRKKSERLARKYSLLMLSGQWYVNPQPLILSEFVPGATKAQLEDGQHRLDGLIMADQEQPGIEMPFVICLNAPRDSMWVVDQGKGRIPADWLAMFGEANAQKLSHAVGMLYAVEMLRPFKSVSLWRASKLTPQTQQEFLDKHPDIRYALDESLKLKSQIIPYVGAVLYYLMRREYGNWLTQEFFKGIATGADLSIDDPRLKVREFMALQKAAKHKWDGFEQLGLLIAACNAWLVKSESFRARNAFNKTHTKFPELVSKETLPTTEIVPGNDPQLS